MLDSSRRLLLRLTLFHPRRHRTLHSLRFAGLVPFVSQLAFPVISIRTIYQVMTCWRMELCGWYTWSEWIQRNDVMILVHTRHCRISNSSGRSNEPICNQLTCVNVVSKMIFTTQSNTYLTISWYNIVLNALLSMLSNSFWSCCKYCWT